MSFLYKLNGVAPLWLKMGTFSIAAILLFCRCAKINENSKPNINLVTPQSIADCQALLDNYALFNYSQPGLGELATDEYYYSPANFGTLPPVVQFAYNWTPDVFQSSQIVTDWDHPYSVLQVANLVLEELSGNNIADTNSNLFNNAKGSAYFFRGWEFYVLAQTFALPYDSSTSSKDLGIPLKLASDVNDVVGRSTNDQTYKQVIEDLKVSARLLPNQSMGGNLFRPSRLSAYGVLSRVYLAMNDPQDAFLYADSCLKINGALVDFNTLNPTDQYPLPYPSPEINFDYTMVNYAMAYKGYVDSNLYRSYDSNDLRKSMYFRSDGTGMYFKGCVNKDQYSLWLGLSSDEMYLTRAESSIRMGSISAGLADLNHLLDMRYVTNTFSHYSLTDPVAALNLVLSEREKELVFRGDRWETLRRIKVAQNITLSRTLNGTIYTLMPNDSRYAYPIPQEELLYNPIPQNER
jgi:hypothetical protein